VRVKEANALGQCRLLKRLLGSLSALPALTFAYLVWDTAEAASPPGANVTAVVASVSLLAGTTVTALYLVVARRRA